MTSIPIQFVVAFLLIVISAINHQALYASPTGRVFAQILYINAFALVLVGLRWSWDLVAVLPVVATLSVLSSAMLYLAFCSLGRSGPVLSRPRDWPHAAPIMLVAICAVAAPTWMEALLIVTKAAYIFLFLRLAKQVPMSLQRVRLSWLKNSQHALWGAAGLQMVSMAVDVAITLDFIVYDGRHAASLVGFVSLVILFALGYIVVLAGRGQAHCTSQAADAETRKAELGLAASEPDVAEMAQLMEKLNALLVDQKLYADTDLNLQRIARKAGVPARSISRTVNTLTELNVSQWVNTTRIEVACRLLENTDASISDVMLNAGFLTKSNFNREFRRIKGSSPSEWRKSTSS